MTGRVPNVWIPWDLDSFASASTVQKDPKTDRSVGPTPVRSSFPQTIKLFPKKFMVEPKGSGRRPPIRTSPWEKGRGKCSLIQGCKVKSVVGSKAIRSVSPWPPSEGMEKCRCGEIFSKPWRDWIRLKTDGLS